MSNPGKVTVFGLYGEEKPEESLGFVHIEKVSTRSSLHDWQIKPHAHNGMFQLLFLSAGEAEVRLDRALHNISAPAAICTPGSVVHGFQFLPGTEGWVLTVGESLLTDDPDPRTRALIGPLLVEPVLMQLEHGAEPAGLIDAMLGRLNDEFNWPGFGRGAMFDWMVRIVLVAIRRRQEDQAPTEPTKRIRRERFVRFRLLLEEHYKEHWPVEQYADALGLTLARLNRICRAMTEKTAGALIQDRLTLEAQRLLIYTNATSSMVAFELGFHDPAYFARFFKRRTGLSPIEFRHQQEDEVG